MNKRQAYDLCCKYRGKMVCITDNRGQKHIGRITKVDGEMVWIMPYRGCGGRGSRGGYGLGYWGFGGGFGYGYGSSGFGYGIALGAILGIALVGALRW